LLGLVTARVGYPLCVTDTEGRAAESSEGHEIAEAAGLRYLPGDRPGLSRARRGRGFSYTDAFGAPVSPAERQRIGAMAIPPAWTDVWIAPEPDAHLLAVGTDAAGRRQYLYHPAWRAAADRAKFDRLATFGPALGALRRRVADDLRRLGDEWPCAAVVRLIDESLIRPGSLRHFRDNGSVGATTLHAEHVETSRRVVRLHFEGKGSVEHDIEVHDPLLARRISDLLDNATPGQPIFTGGDGAIVDNARLNDYLGRHTGRDFTAKDLRTWGATCRVAGRLVLEPLASTRRRPTKGEDPVRRAVEHAAEQLGNTFEVCRSSYVDPRIVEAFHLGELAAVWQRSRRGRWLSRTEQTVHRVLARSPDA
jgi:DNA topoisomerase I